MSNFIKVRVCIASLVNILIIFGNLLTIIIFVRRLRLYSFRNEGRILLLTSLACADISIGLLVMPLSIADILNSYTWQWGSIACYFWGTCDTFFCAFSLFSLIALVVDRYLLAMHPTFYERYISKGKMTILIGFIWLCGMAVTGCLLYATDDFLDQSYYLYNNATKCGRVMGDGSVIALLVGFYLHIPILIIILVITWYKISRITKHAKTNEVSVAEEQQIKDDRKSLKIITSVVSVCVLSLIPIFLIGPINFFCSCLSAIAFESAMWIGYAKSAMNPIIYIFMEDGFKKSIVSLFRRNDVSRSEESQDVKTPEPNA